MGIAAEWTDDCNGKKDFDGPIIEIRTRYWPRGGGFDAFDSRTKAFESNADRPDVNPSAKASIILCDRECDHSRTIAESEFEGDTEADVKRQVEEWANRWQMKIFGLVESDCSKVLTEVHDERRTGD